MFDTRSAYLLLILVPFCNLAIVPARGQEPPNAAQEADYERAILKQQLKALEESRAAEKAQQLKLEAQLQAMRDQIVKLTEQASQVTIAKQMVSELEASNRELQQKLDEMRAKFDAQLKVFVLRYAQAADAARIAQDALPSVRIPGGGRGDAAVNIAVDERTNALIVRGPEQLLSTIEKLLDFVDQQANPEQESQHKVERAYHLASKELLERVADRISREGAEHGVVLKQMEVTQHGGPFTVLAPNAGHTWLAEVIDEYRQKATETKTVTLRASWLVQARPDQQGVVPEYLKPVVAELEKQGITGMTVAAQAAIRSTYHQQFQLSSAINPVPLDGRPCELNIQGAFGGDNSLEISLFARATGGDGPSQLAHIQTRMHIPSGHPVVLGVAPINDRNSAFVVTVEE